MNAPTKMAANAICLPLLCLVLIGCNSKPPIPKSYPVQGEVTLDGKPMATGEVVFVSVKDGIRDTVKVIDGKFSGEVLAGDRKVEVRSYVPVAANTNMYGPNEEQSMKNIIPKKFNEETTLTATVEESDKNNFQFEVTST
ncbi:hypothetical protein AB1L30_15150 [Bremerella sp. JC817]|uniref:hypothetical protein n=1 Tax=Bremerella sp. JC817 TaxID=3231756 RepID=UPI00345B4BC4